MNVPHPSPELALSALFPFELDPFQQQAIAALEAGRSVVVCAPTGSGKTAIGEYAIYRALKRGNRVFYTTPLKALSNQKLRDFREQFGTEQVGLLTGDTSVNREAPILVMTTEIFRNMLYGTHIGAVGTSVAGVEAVVLDECHYMNDRQRGTVWEESVIYCPPEIQLVALSATVANGRELTDWIHQVHGPTELIDSDFRPVPLEFYFGNPKGLFPLLNSQKTKLHPSLKKKRRGRGGSGKQRGGRPESPSLLYTLNQLQQQDMLPAIYFIFSRRGCDRAVDSLGNLSLVNLNEAKTLQFKLDEFLARNPEAGRLGQMEPLTRGIAAHHAGILPAWKGFVEELFQAGLIKVVFATETLAAGINMPARTTVISSLSKRTDRGHRLLYPSEFLQMAGRAGRRGMDDLGHVVTLQTPFEGAKEAAYLATSEANPLVSQFTPSYGMVLNLLQNHSLEETRELIERSFGQYLATLHLLPQQQAIADLAAEAEQIQAQLAGVDLEALSHYEKLRACLREEQRLLKTLEQQAQAVRSSDMAVALAFAVAGTILSLKGKHVPTATPIPAVLVADIPGSGQAPYLVCLGQNNRWYVVTAVDVMGLHGEFPRLAAVDGLSLPVEMPLKPGQGRKGDEATAAIAAQIPAIASLEQAPEVCAQQQRVNAMVAQQDAHPAHQWRDRSKLLKRKRRLLALEDEIHQRQDQLQEQTQQYWNAFLQLIEVLQRFDCLDGLVPTPSGQAVAAIRGDNELWLGLALMSGELDRLDPHHFAATCAALSTEVSRPDIWTNYSLSPEVEQALGGLWPLRQRLIKIQSQHRVAIPVWPERKEQRFIFALVEQWALETDWPELCDNTSLDEGDVVRILRRTLDFLSQVPYVPHISDPLRQNAYRAIHLLNRFPVNEIVD